LTRTCYVFRRPKLSSSALRVTPGSSGRQAQVLASHSHGSQAVGGVRAMHNAAISMPSAAISMRNAAIVMHREELDYFDAECKNFKTECRNLDAEGCNCDAQCNHVSVPACPSKRATPRLIRSLSRTAAWSESKNAHGVCRCWGRRAPAPAPPGTLRFLKTEGDASPRGKKIGLQCWATRTGKTPCDDPRARPGGLRGAPEATVRARSGSLRP